MHPGLHPLPLFQYAKLLLQGSGIGESFVAILLPGLAHGGCYLRFFFPPIGFLRIGLDGESSSSAV